MEEHTNQAPVSLPPLFDECTHAVLTSLAFATSATVISTSAAATLAKIDTSAPLRRVVDEFDLSSPSPPRNFYRSDSEPQHQLLQPAQAPYRLDLFTPSALTLHCSQQVFSLHRLEEHCVMITSLEFASHNPLSQLLACLLASPFVSARAAAVTSAAMLLKVILVYLFARLLQSVCVVPDNISAATVFQILPAVDNQARNAAITAMMQTAFECYAHIGFAMPCSTSASSSNYSSAVCSSSNNNDNNSGCSDAIVVMSMLATDAIVQVCLSILFEVEL
jgi:hypothetical protein